MKLKFSLLLIGFLLVFSKNSFGQLDSIFLKDGRILTEPYSVSFDKRNLVNKKNPDLKIPASSVKKFKTKKKYLLFR